MLHAPAAPTGKDPSAPYKARLGVWMFIAYSLFYGGFVVINLVSPQMMEATVLFGLNLAVVYGFALIVVALIQALLYDAACRAKEKSMASDGDKEGGPS
jgi:uncharacterized membrane protein (DUF485 family)